MSVQVRRRREAAPFLATYVGAQGELLVDVTNNRVQVHDGASPGGWPAARTSDLSGRNAMINGNFMINQRAYASATALAAGAYAHDHWKAGAGGCTYTFTQAANDTTITVSAGSLVQVVEGAAVCETTYVLSWTGTAQARVYQGAPPSGGYSAGSATTTALDGAKNDLVVAGLTIGTAVTVEFATGTIATVQLETALPNVGPSNFERRHPALDLALCQRYYQTYVTMLVSGYAGAANAAIYDDFGFNATMRAAPTVTLVSPAYFNSSALSVNGTIAGHVRFSLTAAAAGSAFVTFGLLSSAEL